MKKYFLKILILSFAPALLFAQVAPDWWESSSRAMHYPKDKWFTGFILGEQQPGERIEDTFARLKDEARIEAAASVKTLVQKEMFSSNNSEMIQTSSDFDEHVTEVLRSKTLISVNVEIPGLKVDAWQDPNSHQIAAFAYALRSEVERKTEKRITALLSKLELILLNADELIDSGQKMQARQTAEKALPIFVEIEELQKLLLSISDDIDALQLNEANRLRKQFINLLTFLKHGIIIYIAAKCELFDETYDTFIRQVTGQLSDMGCEFTNTVENADWAINITSSAREYNKTDFGGVSLYTVYADGTLTIDKMITHQRIYQDEINVKGTHTISYKEAARQAYKELINQISSIIKEQIQL